MPSFKKQETDLKKIIFTHPQFGDKQYLLDTETTTKNNSILDQILNATIKKNKQSNLTDEILNKTEMEVKFREIVKEGYGQNVTSVVHATFTDGSEEAFSGDEALSLLDYDKEVEEVIFVAPLAGG